MQEFAEGGGFGRGMAAIHRKKIMAVVMAVVGILGFNPSPLNDLLSCSRVLRFAHVYRKRVLGTT